jgi:hypothetical protein
LALVLMTIVYLIVGAGGKEVVEIGVVSEGRNAGSRIMGAQWTTTSPRKM